MLTVREEAAHVLGILGEDEEVFVGEDALSHLLVASFYLGQARSPVHGLIGPRDQNEVLLYPLGEES